MMNLKKIGALAAAVLVSGGVLAGAAFAAETTTPPAPADASAQTEKGARPQLTEGEKGLLQKLQDLRKSYMEKLQAESKTLIDAAVKDGSVTQEQGDRLLNHGGRGGKGGPGEGFGRGGRGGKGHGFGSFGFKGMTQEDLKAKLDANVAAGKLTQEQADQMLKHFAEEQAEHAAQQAPVAPETSK